jgi:hypothetical protein
LLDDSRGLATVAHELYCGTAARQAAPAQSLSALPRRRRKAIETALAAREAAGLGVTEFLAIAGLKCDGRRPRRRSGRVVEFPSPARLAWPVAGFAAIGVALYAGDDVDWSWALTTATSEPRDRPQDAEEPTVAAPESDERDVAVAPPTPAASVAARTAPASVVRRTESQTSAGATAAARDTAVVSPGPDAAAATAGASDARASAPRREATLTVQPVTVNENQRVAKVTVVRSGDLRRRLDFVWFTIEATAHAGDDYADFGARIESFGPGEAKRTLSIPLASDSVPEPSETFYIRLDVEREAGHRGEPTTAEVRIIDDDVRSARR